MSVWKEKGVVIRDDALTLGSSLSLKAFRRSGHFEIIINWTKRKH